MLLKDAHKKMALNITFFDSSVMSLFSKTTSPEEKQWDELQNCTVKYVAIQMQKRPGVTCRYIYRCWFIRQEFPCQQQKCLAQPDMGLPTTCPGPSICQLSHITKNKGITSSQQSSFAETHFAFIRDLVSCLRQNDFCQ